MDSHGTTESVEKMIVPSRRPHTARGWSLAALSFSTLGVIYSDIGTSPLYTLNGIWPANEPAPSKEDVIGGISTIVWALTLLPLLKYVFICLHFGTGEGEGGSFALFQGLYPPPREDVNNDRILTGDSAYKTKSIHASGHIPDRLRWPLLAWCLFATGLTMADGILTPAVSLTSAAAGIAVAKPSIASSTVTGIALAFLVAFFLVQPFGTGKIAFMFAPVTFIWLMLIGTTGIANITAHPGILRAFDPSRAVMFFVRTRAYDDLAGVILALTGCEAMFANLGQFNMLSIQISFTGIVYPCILLAYLGQGARLIRDGDAVINNVFYSTIPGSSNGPLFWIVFTFGILATLTASQAMVTATFSLIQQVVNMKSLPPIRIKHTSKIQGQVFVPIVNWILMIAVIVFVAAFKNSTNLTNAYGFAVATVMFSTSTLIAIQIVYVKHLPIVIAVGFFLTFGFFDGLLWGAALRKVPQGAWAPLMLGSIMMFLMLFWTWAKRLEDRFDGANRRNLRHFIVTGEKGQVAPPTRDLGRPGSITSEVDEADSDYVQEQYYYFPRDKTATEDEDRRELVRIPTCAIFHKFAAGKGVPHSFVGFIRQWPTLPQVVIFLSVSVLSTPRVPADERYDVNKVRSVKGFYGVTYYIGFREDFEVKVDEIIGKICSLESSESRKSPETITEIKRAALQTTHVVPHYHVMSKVDLRKGGSIHVPSNWIRKFFIESIYRRLIISFPETAKWNGPADEIIRVGITAKI